MLYKDTYLRCKYRLLRKNRNFVLMCSWKSREMKKISCEDHCNQVVGTALLLVFVVFGIMSCVIYSYLAEICSAKPNCSCSVEVRGKIPYEGITIILNTRCHAPSCPQVVGRPSLSPRTLFNNNLFHASGISCQPPSDACFHPCQFDRGFQRCRPKSCFFVTRDGLAG